MLNNNFFKKRFLEKQLYLGLFKNLLKTVHEQKVLALSLT